MWNRDKVTECKLLVLALNTTRSLDFFFIHILLGTHHATPILLLSEHLHILSHVPLMLPDHSLTAGEPINDHSLELELIFY